MAQPEHRLEKRARLMADRLRQRIDSTRDMLAPPGQRPPFSEQLSKPSALAWWRIHRYTPLGEQAIAQMALTPTDVAELDVALARQIEAERNGGVQP